MGLPNGERDTLWMLNLCLLDARIIWPGYLPIRMGTSLELSRLLEDPTMSDVNSLIAGSG